MKSFEEIFKETKVQQQKDIEARSNSLTAGIEKIAYDFLMIYKDQKKVVIHEIFPWNKKMIKEAVIRLEKLLYDGDLKVKIKTSFKYDDYSSDYIKFTIKKIRKNQKGE